MGVIDIVSEMCRNRSVTHLLLSPETYDEYKSLLTQRHKRAGIRASTCHSVAILTIDGMQESALFSFNYKRSPVAQDLLHAVRSERYDDALTIIDSLLQQRENGKAKWLHTCWFGEEDDEAPGE